MNETTVELKPSDAIAQSWVDSAPQKLQPYLRLARLDRPIGTWLLFWPCIFGLVLGAIASERAFSTAHDLYLVVLFGLGAIIMRGAGCTYNDIVDRHIDASVARTRDRPLPSGSISVRRAWAFLALELGIGLLILMALKPFAIWLGASSLLLVAAYPFMKRITWWPQAWLGLTFNFGALLGFAAQTGRLDIADALLYGGLFFWTLGYDTIYAHQDKDDDALIGVKSTARLFNTASRRWVLSFYTLAFALILSAGFTEHAGWPFAFIMLSAGGHLLWQVHHLDIDNPENCLMLFRSNRDSGLLIALAFLVSSWIW